MKHTRVGRNTVTGDRPRCAPSSTGRELLGFFFRLAVSKDIRERQVIFKTYCGLVVYTSRSSGRQLSTGQPQPLHIRRWTTETSHLHFQSFNQSTACKVNAARGAALMRLRVCNLDKEIGFKAR